jgi:hypothetical protein
MDFRRLFTVAILAIALLLVYYSNHSFTFTNEVLITTTTIHQALAQVPPIPTPPEIDDETIAGIQPPTKDSGQSQLPQSATPPNTSIPPTPTIQITSHQDGSQVPVGELTIQGTSSDNPERNCQVYADVNDIAPLQNATATGVNGGDDYSQWTFTYTQDYQLITQGANELTAKISCFDVGITAMPLSEWHSINVTGVVSSGTSTPTTTPAAPTPTLPATQMPTTDEVPGAEQGGSFIPSPITPPSLPFGTSEQPSEDLSQGGGEGDDDDDDDDDDGGDDEGDDVGGDDDDDGGDDG